MRSHKQIVRDIGHDKLASLTGRKITAVRSWDQRDSIPSDAWLLLVGEGYCSADELMLGAVKAA